MINEEFFIEEYDIGGMSSVVVSTGFGLKSGFRC
jgi:hypothetical protein